MKELMVLSNEELIKIAIVYGEFTTIHTTVNIS